MNEKMELNLLLLHGCYKKLAVQCSADTFVVNQTLVLRINICGKNRQLLVAAKRCARSLRSRTMAGSYATSHNKRLCKSTPSHSRRPLQASVKRPCNMTTDEQTMTDIRTNTAQRTGKHSSRPEEVLFFPTAHFLFFKFYASRTFGTLPFARNRTSQTRGQKSKSQISQRSNNSVTFETTFIS